MKDDLASFILKRGESRRFLIYMHDLIVTTAAFPISLLLRENFEVSDLHFQSLLYGSTIIFVTAFVVFGLTDLQRIMWRYITPPDLLSIIKTVSLIVGIFVSFMFLFDRMVGLPRSIIVIFWLVATAGLVGSRVIYGYIMSSGLPPLKKTSEPAPQRVLILGRLAPAVTVIQKIRALHAHRLRVVGILSDNAEPGRIVHGAPILGATSNFEQIRSLLEAQGLSPDLMIVTDPNDINPMVQHSLDACPVPHTEAVHLDNIALPNASLSKYERLFQNPPRDRTFLRVKRVIESSIAAFALICALPILALIALLLLSTMGTPVLFTQCRAGKHMREFALLKFRTMHNAFDSSGKILGDSDRTSFIGSILRFTRLDELPQLWNIVNGNMALIGPRPLLLRDLPSDPATIQQRYAVRPGLTGWAQVNGGQQLTQEQKMALDLYYIKNASFLLDMKILFLTIPVVLFGERVNTDAIASAELALSHR